MYNNKKSQSGSVVTYILAAIFLSGLLVATLSQGSKKSVDSSHIEREVSFLRADIESIHYAISECIQVYPEWVDVNDDQTIDNADNPNPPFPLYGDMSHSASGDDFRNIKCPAAPISNNSIFLENLYNSVKLLSNADLYTTTYFNDPDEGVYIKVSTSNPDEIWKESISRVNDMYSTCSVEIIKDAAECVGDCLYYWVSRPATSQLGDEAACNPNP